MAGHDRDDAKFAALEQRVYGLERGVQDLGTRFSGEISNVSAQIAGLAAKLDERSRTPWATIVSAMGVVLAVVVAGGQLAKMPIDDAISRLERDQAALDRDTVPLPTFTEFKSTYENNRTINRLDIDAKVAKLNADIKTLEDRRNADRDAVVPRAEHQERWRAQDQAVASVQRQVDDLKAAFGGIYGARDVIIDLRERLDRVERARGSGGN